MSRKRLTPQTIEREWLEAAHGFSEVGELLAQAQDVLRGFSIAAEVALRNGGWVRFGDAWIKREVYIDREVTSQEFREIVKAGGMKGKTLVKYCNAFETGAGVGFGPYMFKKKEKGFFK